MKIIHAFLLVVSFTGSFSYGAEASLSPSLQLGILCCTQGDNKAEAIELLNQGADPSYIDLDELYPLLPKPKYDAFGSTEENFSTDSQEIDPQLAQSFNRPFILALIHGNANIAKAIGAACKTQKTPVPIAPIVLFNTMSFCLLHQNVDLIRVLVRNKADFNEPPATIKDITWEDFCETYEDSTIWHTSLETMTELLLPGKIFSVLRCFPERYSETNAKLITKLVKRVVTARKSLKERDLTAAQGTDSP